MAVKTGLAALRLLDLFNRYGQDEGSHRHHTGSVMAGVIGKAHQFDIFEATSTCRAVQCPAARKGERSRDTYLRPENYFEFEEEKDHPARAE